MSFLMRIKSFGETVFFQVGFCTSLQTMGLIEKDMLHDLQWTIPEKVQTRGVEDFQG